MSAAPAKRAGPTVAESETQIREQIAQEIEDVQANSYGSGTTAVHVELLEDMVLIVIDVVLTRAEETLVGAGNSANVKSMREAFQSAIEPTFKAIVERHTGRKVTSFLSSMSMDDPPYSIEFYRLAPPA